MAKNNRIYSDERWDKVCDYNKMIFDDFMLNIRAERKSEGTIKQYDSNIKRFMIYNMLHYGNKPINELKSKSFRNYILYMQENGNSVATINASKSAISSLLNYASNDEDYEDDIPLNLMRKLKPLQKEPVRDIIFLSREQVDLVRDTLIKNENYQVCLLWDIISQTGIRHNEVYQIKKNWIVKNSNKTTEDVIGKRKKKFKVRIHPRIRESYELYMKQRGNDNVDELWINQYGKPASYEALYYWVVNCRNILEDENGITPQFNLHSLRHYFVDGMIKGYHNLCDCGRTYTLQQVQAMVSHSSSETTSGYCKNSQDDIVDEAFSWMDE